MRFTRTTHIAAPREKVWHLMADTDRLNREIGLSPVRYEFLPRDIGGSEMFGTTELGPLRLRYRELPFEWARPEFHSVRRLFENGPIREFRARLTLTEENGGTRVDSETALIPRNLAAAPLVRLVGGKFMNDLTGVWQSFAAYLSGQAAIAYPRHSGQPPARADRLEQRLARLEQAGADREAARRLAETLAHAPPEDVTALRPFALADRWGMERIAVLRTCLLAATQPVQLLELRWRLLCPACRGASPENVARHLEDVPAEVHCPSCNIRFDADFDESVEVSFAVAPAVRPVQDAPYCRGGPGLSPHVWAQWALEPGETRNTLLHLPPGRFTLVSPQAPASLTLRVQEGGAAECCANLEPQEAGALLIGDAAQIAPQARARLTNRLSEAAVFRLESPEPGEPVVTAAFVSSLQTFRDQFSSEALAPGTELAVRQICVLFSDLKGSTAMYQQQGDAPSYRIVRDHFAALRRIIAEHDGAVVKTIGDAIMATFSDPAQGLAAALAIQRDAPAWPDRLTVKLGLHSGPAIAVNANGLLDYFGRTVNLAARLQSESQGGDIILAEELTQDARIAALLREQGYRAEPFAATVRGVAAPIAMLRVTPQPPSARH